MNIIITGATKGIGRAIAEKLVRNGVNIAYCSRNEQEVWATAKDLYGIQKVRIFHSTADLSKKEDCKKFIDAAIADMGTIDALINNAGMYIGGTIAAEAEGTLEQMMNTNLYSAYYTTRALLPHMMHRQQGHIINICSIAGLQAYQNGGSYSISKFAMVGFSKNLREEMKPHNVKVSTINPGATMSNSWAGSEIDPRRIMEANDIAEAIWMMLNLAPQSVVEDITMRPQLGDL